MLIGPTYLSAVSTGQPGFQGSSWQEPYTPHDTGKASYHPASAGIGGQNTAYTRRPVESSAQLSILSNAEHSGHPTTEWAAIGHSEHARVLDVLYAYGQSVGDKVPEQQAVIAEAIKTVNNWLPGQRER